MAHSLIIQLLNTCPDLLALHGQFPQRYPHLLSSNASAIALDENHCAARFDILFACPQESIRCEQLDEETQFLDKLDQQWQLERRKLDEYPEHKDLPFTGGWFVYLSYELAQQIEAGLNLPVVNDDLPIAMATRFPAAIIYDSVKQQTFLVCEKAYEDCYQQILSDLLAEPNSQLYQQTFDIQDIAEDRAEDYLQQLETLHRYIVEGDVFQVNLSRRWSTELNRDVNHASLYHQLCQSNPGPFNALVTFGDQSIISSSPERLVRLKDGWLEARPIAGTRPRGTNVNDDAQLSSELLAHPKERAEHIMLIDLERNDLGRVCQPGSIEVNELMVLESYRHVHHIVSNVRGRPVDGKTPGQLIAAVFPGGTITGCPKVRCMEILAELEQQGRGAYTGSLGYINHDGSMDLNILIRTITRNGSQLSFRAGGGIVVDSVAENELKETRAKAQGMLHALQTGNR